MVAGSAERLFDECSELVVRARQAAVAAEWIMAPDMPHNPPALADFHPKAAAAFERSGRFIAEMLQR